MNSKHSEPLAAKTQSHAETNSSGSEKVLVLAFMLGSVAFIFWFGYLFIGGNRPIPETLTGAQLFRRLGCAACHSIDHDTAGRGPSLYELDKNVVRRINAIKQLQQRTLTEESYVIESLVQPDSYIVEGYQLGLMKAVSPSPTQLKKLVSYLLKRGSNDPAVIKAVDRLFPNQAQASKEEALDLAAVKRGEKFFHGFGTCASCHSVAHSAAENSMIGPNLFGIGHRPRTELMESIVNPDAVIAPQYQQVLLYAEGQTISGILEKMTRPTPKSRGLLHIRQTGQIVKVPFDFLRAHGPFEFKVETHLKEPQRLDLFVSSMRSAKIDEASRQAVDESAVKFTVAIQNSKQSLMPNLAHLFDEQQLEDLVEYLKSLK